MGQFPYMRDDPNLESRYFSISHSSAGVSLVFEPAWELTLGSNRRAADARRCVANALKRQRLKGVIDRGSIRAIIPPHEISVLRDLVSELDAALDAFREERLHPRVVEEILGITGRERRDWTKDRRLPTTGSGTFRGGQHSIHFPLYPVAKIAALAQQPGLVEAWRREDNNRHSKGDRPKPV